jgi:ribosome-associated translation inhibitor RaiA
MCSAAATTPVTMHTYPTQLRFETKRKEVMSDPQHQAEAIDKAHEKRTTQLRKDKDKLTER